MKRGKPSVDLVMDDSVVHSFAAETDQDIEAWLVALQRVIQSNEMGSIEKIRGS